MSTPKEGNTIGKPAVLKSEGKTLLPQDELNSFFFELMKGPGVILITTENQGTTEDPKHFKRAPEENANDQK